MAVSDWSSPNVFTLTNPFNTVMEFNVQTADGLYLLDNQACKFRIGTRVTKDHIPQFDGDILHYRFLTGVEIDLSIQLWETVDHPACDELLLEMLDSLGGALRSLLNAGDNQGRLAWEIPSGGNTRMLDDIRLLTYPDEVISGPLTTVNVTIDSRYPYAQDLTEGTPVSFVDITPQAIVNQGTAEYWPVYKVYGPTSSFEIVNSTTGETLDYAGTAIGGGDYVELNAFNDTAFLNGDGADLLDGIDLAQSLFPRLTTGSNTLEIIGTNMDVLWANAWA